MAAAECTLDHNELSAQLDRYRQLGATVARIERHANHAHVLFSRAVDRRLLKDTIRIEQECCSFFTLGYDPSTRMLLIGVDSEHENALSVLLTALTPQA
jgi:hypothetical protein